MSYARGWSLFLEPCSPFPQYFYSDNSLIRFLDVLLFPCHPNYLAIELVLIRKREKLGEEERKLKKKEIRLSEHFNQQELISIRPFRAL